MNTPITSEIVVAYSLCPRKAFLLLSGDHGQPAHEYDRIIGERAAATREGYRKGLPGAECPLDPSEPRGLESGRQTILDAVLSADSLEAHCDVLRRVQGTTALGKYGYEPIMAVGTHRLIKPQVTELAYAGHILGQLQGRPPTAGTVVLAGNRPQRVKLASHYRKIRTIIGTLKGWVCEPPKEPPPVVLNKHCPCCPFREACRQLAEKEDNLSLLDRMTPKLMQKYHNKGIFTINQLSYLFKPRRSRKKGKRPVRHSLELQALAIRTGKTYIEHLPEIPRSDVELFVDIEGIPDQDSYYLIGLLVCSKGDVQYHSFWANSEEEEGRIWSSLVDHAELFPNAPMYHYGSYERKAFKTLAKRHGKGQGLAGRLVNVASSVYGKIYFPVRSNGLKVLGTFVGATWTSPESSGLQSLVWRHKWETTREEQHNAILLQYNREDCEAVRRLLDFLSKIKQRADSESTVDFAHHPKQLATEIGNEIHRQLEWILWSGQNKSGRGKFYVRSKSTGSEREPRKRGAPKGHRAFHRIMLTKANRAVRVPPRRRCPKGHGDLELDAKKLAERIVIDLVFIKNGCRKATVRYFGKKGYCQKCDRYYSPPCLDHRFKHAFGHAFQVWTVYQRIILRLPYRIITQVTEHLFGVGLNPATVVSFLGYLADYYTATEKALFDALRKSPFVHADETRISIQGVDHYVWVFTDGKHVLFRMTETREADIVYQVLSGYKGVLISDFYPGYDAVPCRQQKCLVHLIRDINDDLWEAPFDQEFEGFALEVKSLLVPILEAVDRYGLKAWHLRKFEKSVERFYDKNIAAKEYASERAIKYQKRFQRYRESLFTFLREDGIPWNNNMGERAIRQLAIQRKISGFFFKRVAEHYLLLLAIAQTCRFQEKSFLKFLLSKSKDVDGFRRTRPIKYSAPVEPAQPTGNKDKTNAQTTQEVDVLTRETSENLGAGFDQARP